MDLTVASVEKAALKSTEYRKVIKPLLERRRRARINNCLDELKALIMETAQTENSDASKLEKADILELTVQHLRRLRTQSRAFTAASVVTRCSDVDRFRAGFSECAKEVSTFVSSLGGVDNELRNRLVGHLSHCITNIPQPQQPQPQTPVTSVMQTTCLVSTPTPPPSPISPASPMSPVPQDLTAAYTTTTSPSRLPTSPMPYVWPSDMGHHHHHQIHPHGGVIKMVQTSPVVQQHHSPSSSWRRHQQHQRVICAEEIMENQSSKPWRPW